MLHHLQKVNYHLYTQKTSKSLLTSEGVDLMRDKLQMTNLKFLASLYSRVEMIISTGMIISPGMIISTERKGNFVLG